MEDRPLLTIPHVLSMVRGLCIPLFGWLVFGAGGGVAAGLLLLVLGATDWVDGWIARRFDQVSNLGKILDPVADRALLLTAVVSLMVDGALPVWLGLPPPAPPAGRRAGRGSRHEGGDPGGGRGPPTPPPH